MEKRRISLLVGKKSYNVLTSLDDDKLRAVNDVLQDIMSNIDPAIEQEERLFLACVTIARELVETTSRLENMLPDKARLAGKTEG